MFALNRVLLLGNRTLSISVLDHLRNQPGVSIFAVANPDDTGVDGPGGLSLVRRLDAWSIPYIQPKGINNPEVIAKVAAFAPDLAISCSYARIIPKSVIDLPRYGCLNIHYAALPLNRGCLPVIWTIAGAERDYCATLHHVDVGIDDGDIVAQARRPLTPGMTAAEVNANCAALGYDLFRAFWSVARPTGRFDSTPQDSQKATYHTLRFPHDRWIPWHKPAEEVAHFINALTFLPHPSARTNQRGDSAEICPLGPVLPHLLQGPVPGEVLKVTDKDVVVACGKGSVVFQSLRDRDGSVPAAARFVSGQHLSSPVTEFYAE